MCRKFVTHLTKGNETLHFFYDAQSKPAMVEYNGAMYRYVHNLQGDIVGILDSAGALVVEYKYDAWGKSISATGSLASTLGKHNPFRYRGYVWDEEIGMYYLRNRYYSAVFGKMLSFDLYINELKLCGTNLFSYGNNLPLSYADPSGNMSLIILPNSNYEMPISGVLKECTCNTDNTIANAEDTIKTALRSTYFYGGVGGGIGGSLSLGSAMSISLEAKIDLLAVKTNLDYSELDLGNNFSLSAEAGIAFTDVDLWNGKLGYEYSEWISYLDGSKTVTQGLDSEFDIFAAGLYRGLGGSIHLAFDKNRFLAELKSRLAERKTRRTTCAKCTRTMI